MGNFPVRYVSHNQRALPIKHIIKHYYGIFMVFNGVKYYYEWICMGYLHNLTIIIVYLTH